MKTEIENLVDKCGELRRQVRRTHIEVVVTTIVFIAALVVILAWLIMGAAIMAPRPV